ncbi:MAG: DUF6370 family protein [Ginsengibacter sp.]
MKTLLTVFSLTIISSTIMAQAKLEKLHVSPDPNKVVQVVDASCGECQFDLPGKSCDLAVRINGKSYFVDGTNIDDHGDAHAKEGFCEAVRKAEVQGEIVNNRFKATYFKLIDDNSIKPPHIPAKN